MKKHLHFFFCTLVVLSAAFAKAQIGTNIDFGTGTISGWNYDEGINANSLTMATVSGFSASTAYSVMAPGSTEVMGVPITMTSPLGGDFVRVGRPTAGGYAGRLSQTFTVPTGTTGLLVSYAEVLEIAAHACSDNPYFYLTLKDASGNVIPGTSVYSVNGGGTGGCSSYDPSLSTSGSYSYKNWVTLSYNLSAYVGTAVTIEVYGSGCVQTGHLGYCYFDAQSCSGSSTPSTLVANGVSYPLPSAQNYLSICGSSSVTVTAPSGASSYQWSGTGINGLTTQSVSITQTGVYSMVCNIPSACSPTTAVTFTVSGTSPTVAVVASNSVVCGGAAVTLTASGALSYTWAPYPNSLAGTTTQQGAYTPSVTSTYTIVGSDSNGCIDSVTYQVSVLASPTLAVTGNTTICSSGGSTTLTASGANTYAWSTGVNTASMVVTPTTTATYTVTGTNANGCSKTQTVSVAVNTSTLPVNPYVAAKCLAPYTIPLSASGATTYTWSTGDTTATINVSPTVTTTYTVGGTNSCGTFTNSVVVTVYPPPAFSVSGPDSTCLTNAVTFNATGNAMSYTWTTVGGNIGNTSGTGPSYTANLNSPAPYTFTVNCVGTATSGCTGTVTKVVKVLASPVLSVSVPSVVCSGSPTTITASGASTYTWTTGANTASIVVTPTATTNYFVAGTGANGCSSTYTAVVTVNNTSLAVTPTSASICPGSSITLGAGGASTYTWSTGVNTSTAQVSPTVTTTYTVGGTSTCGTYTNSILITVYPAPTVAISGPDSLCLTNVVTFTATGTGTSYAWSSFGGFLGSSSGTGPSYSVNLNTPAPYAFTVNCVATGTNGCTSTATRQVKVLAYPSISVSGPTVVCQYSSGTLLASGASTYSWSTGATTASINVIPTATSIYTVTGISSGCSSTNTVQLAVDNTCEDVWPGDANSDGTADNMDVLELGLHYTQTGPARASVSNAWQSFYAADWTGTITNGQNLNHSDCNGDGTIDANDTMAIYLNYGLTHAFKQAQTTSNAQLTIVPDQPSLNAGDWGSASIFLGDAASPISNINGVAYTVNFDQTLVEPGNIYLEYPVSFVNAGNDNLHFRKLDFNNGLIFTATTHTVNNNVSGNGRIATLHYRISTSLSQSGVLNIGLSQGNQSSANGAITPLTTGAATLAVSGTPTTSVNELTENNQTTIYPNPVTDALTIASGADLQKVELLSLTGQVVISQQASGRKHQLKLPGVEEGIYFINVYSNNHIIKREKIVVQK